MSSRKNLTSLGHGIWGSEGHSPIPGNLGENQSRMHPKCLLFCFHSGRISFVWFARCSLLRDTGLFAALRVGVRRAKIPYSGIFKQGASELAYISLCPRPLGVWANRFQGASLLKKRSPMCHHSSSLSGTWSCSRIGCSGKRLQFRIAWLLYVYTVAMPPMCQKSDVFSSALFFFSHPCSLFVCYVHVLLNVLPRTALYNEDQKLLTSVYVRDHPFQEKNAA